MCEEQRGTGGGHRAEVTERDAVVLVWNHKKRCLSVTSACLLAAAAAAAAYAVAAANAALKLKPNTRKTKTRGFKRAHPPSQTRKQKHTHATHLIPLALVDLLLPLPLPLQRRPAHRIRGPQDVRRDPPPAHSKHPRPPRRRRTPSSLPLPAEREQPPAWPAGPARRRASAAAAAVAGRERGEVVHVLVGIEAHTVLVAVSVLEAVLLLVRPPVPAGTGGVLFLLFSQRRCRKNAEGERATGTTASNKCQSSGLTKLVFLGFWFLLEG